MSREKADYRVILEDILSYSGGARLLTLQQAAAFLGVTAITVKRRFGFGRGGVPAAALAYKLAHMED